jgi:hypothetical protein
MHRDSFFTFTLVAVKDLRHTSSNCVDYTVSKLNDKPISISLHYTGRLSGGVFILETVQVYKEGRKLQAD